ncbi:membrane protein FAM174A [Alligator sinensis]|uniref:Transmembrane protein 157 n=1 Tax=Alligator sinensis TaxID=38654 RepID=A0A3Q0HP20_ALLSI|nr:membrane protein FAM174A [Alligator sinensis]
MTQRALSVLVLASAALIVYFVIRTVRLRRRNRKTRRYGVLDTNIENMELTPLEQDDDDDDTTLFDANHPRRSLKKNFEWQCGPQDIVCKSPGIRGPCVENHCSRALIFNWGTVTPLGTARS